MQDGYDEYRLESIIDFDVFVIRGMEPWNAEEKILPITRSFAWKFSHIPLRVRVTICVHPNFLSCQNTYHGIVVAHGSLSE